MWDRKHLLDIECFSRQDFEDVYILTEKLLPYSGVGDTKPRRKTTIARGDIMTLWFEPKYEKSTRTFGSFQGAMARLDGCWKEFKEDESPIEKGESIEDTARILSYHSDIIVDRHRDPMHVHKVAGASTAHVINGGNGSHQHPSQTVLDIYTMKKRRGKIEGSTIAIVGDLLDGRTVHSLCIGLRKFDDVSVVGLYPKHYGLPREYLPNRYEGRPIDMDNMEKELHDIWPDIIYVTRPQIERDTNCQPYQINLDTLKRLKQECFIMHPLPKNSRDGYPEISPEVDNDKRAAYYEQASYGVPTRMALISMLLGYEKMVKCNLI